MKNNTKSLILVLRFALKIRIKYKQRLNKISLDKEELNIVLNCKKGKNKYKESLYKYYYSFGISISLRYSYSKEECIEILNDSFIKVFDKIKSFDENQEFRAWFRRIIINTAIDYYRKNSKIKAFLDFESDEIIESDAISRLSVEDILSLLNRLPEIYRITFNLYEIEGYSHEEIANILETTASTSRANLSRAKKMLREAYINLNKLSYNEAI